MTKFQETETIELKKSTSELKEAVISIVAMLNKHQHGEVLFGIKNDGTVSLSSRIGWKSGVPVSSMAGLLSTASGRKWFQHDGMSCWRNCSSAATALKNGGVASR
jgi:hypothetical protein